MDVNNKSILSFTAAKHAGIMIYAANASLSYLGLMQTGCINLQLKMSVCKLV